MRRPVQRPPRTPVGRACLCVRGQTGGLPGLGFRADPLTRWPHTETPTSASLLPQAGDVAEPAALSLPVSLNQSLLPRARLRCLLSPSGMKSAVPVGGAAGVEEQRERHPAP